jgi:hypothetical protein
MSPSPIAAAVWLPTVKHASKVSLISQDAYQLFVGPFDLALTMAVLLHVLLALCLGAVDARLDGNGRLPVMGWSGYNAFMQNSGHCDTAGAKGYNERVFVETADVLVKTGLSKLGYQYLNLVRIASCYSDLC